MHVPDWQVSAPLQTSPSAQEVPFATALLTQAACASLQESVVQALPSSQFGAVPAVQEPPLQVSAPLQYRPSSQSAFVEQPGVPASRYASQESLARVPCPFVNSYMHASSV